MRKKLKIISGIFIGVFLILLTISGIGYYGYSKDYDEKIEQISTKNFEDTSLENQVTDWNPVDREGLANPRMKIRNSSGTEKISFDHNGTMVGVNLNIDENINATGNITGKYGFFEYLGTQANRIAKGFFINLDVRDNINATNVTAQNIYANINHSYIQNEPDIWVNESGDTMTGNLNMGGNYIINSKFNGTFNWTSGDNWNIFDGSTLTFNESKFDPTYHNPTQAEAVVGTIDGGTLADVQHPDEQYDGVTFNFSEEVGGLDLRINFTGLEVTDFKRGIMRYKTTNLKGDFPIVQMWCYVHDLWEDYPALSTTETFDTMTQPVFFGSNHIEDGVAQMRIYKDGGNTQNHYYIDWIAIVSGVGLPSGSVNLNPYAKKNDSTQNITANYFFGNGSQLTGIMEGNLSWNESLAHTLFAPNTTGGIQSLINSTGVYSTYNVTYAGLINNASYLSTYNATYNAKADYQFTTNNFNGSGNYVSTGDGTFNNVNATDEIEATRLYMPNAQLNAMEMYRDSGSIRWEGVTSSDTLTHCSLIRGGHAGGTGDSQSETPTNAYALRFIGRAFTTEMKPTSELIFGAGDIDSSNSPGWFELKTTRTGTSTVLGYKSDQFGNHKFGDPTGSHFLIEDNGDFKPVGTAGFYPRRIWQSAKPIAGTSSAQIDTGEMAIWVDADNGEVRNCYNDGGNVVCVQLT